MSNRILCKFFAHGACLKGDHCEFSHDWKAPPNNICTYYQKGLCAYGSQCRYDHVKISRIQCSIPSSAAGISFSAEHPSGVAAHNVDVSSVVTGEYSTASETPHDLSRPAWGTNSVHHDLLGNDQGFGYLKNGFADRAICSFVAAGDCPRGNKCPHMHGDPCPICGKLCMHPERQQEREEHIRSCKKRQKYLEALRHSQEIECSVCLELVLSKPILSERKFGILSECDHPFCISCIRNWRGSSPDSGLDVNSALRACPICRKLSYFVIPSVIWYSTKEDKQEIIDSYKTKLKSIDCKHFDFGHGSCPFGTSCFYKHSYRDGSLEEVVLRHLGAEDGNTVIVKDIRLSDFLSNLRLR